MIIQNTVNLEITTLLTGFHNNIKLDTSNSGLNDLLYIRLLFSITYM